MGNDIYTESAVAVELSATADVPKKPLPKLTLFVP